MNIYLKDARHVGYRVILQSLISNTDCGMSYKDLLSSSNFLTSGIQISPYGALSSYGILHKNDDVIKPFTSLIHTACPLIDFLTLDNSVKRKFRTTWDYIWDSFYNSVVEDDNLKQYASILLSWESVAIKLPYAYSIYLSDDVDKKIPYVGYLPSLSDTEVSVLKTLLLYCNMVFRWYCVTTGSNAFLSQNQGTSVLQLYDDLVLNDFNTVLAKYESL